MESSSSSAVRQRAQTACTYCRRRKMKCNNEQPRCMNCKAFDQECVYTQSLKKRRNPASRHRPSDAQLSQLEEENQNLRMRLAHTNSNSPNQSRQSSFSNTGSHPRLDQASTDENTHPFSSPPSPSTGEDDWQGREISGSLESATSYIGLTSASVLEDAPGPKNQKQEATSNIQSKPAVRDVENSRRRLEKEAAEQRRQEASNYYAQKLDFDGVDPDLGMHLLSGHWNRQHHSYLITYRPAFMRDMACQGPYFSKLLLNAIYFSASKFSPRLEVRSDPADVRTAGAIFRQRTKELLVPALERSEITTIQALLLMARSLFALGEGKGVAWTYAGIAFHMIIDLGMHTDQSSLECLSDEDLEIRRRVFWGGFVIDKIQSLCQGRPLTLHSRDCRVPLDLFDHYEENELWQPLDYPGSRHYPQTPTYSVSTFTNLCKLCIIMDEILSTVYAKHRQDQGIHKLKEDIASLQRKLEKWYGYLEIHLKFDPSDTSQVVPPPSVLSLLCIYHVLTIQLHYPLTTRTHHVTVPESDVKDSFAVCSKAAKQIVLILMAYNRTFSILKAPYLIAYATYVSATIHVRDAARRPTAPDTMVYLRTCLTLMDRNGETNPGIENAKSSLTNLMNRLGVICQVDQVPYSNRPDLEFPVHSRSPSTEALAAFWAVPSLPVEPSQILQTASVGPLPGAHTTIDPELENERILQQYAESQFGVPMIDPTYPTQSQDSAMSIQLDFGEQNTVDSLLLDPVGVEYRPNNLGSLEQLEVTTSMPDFTWSHTMP